MFQTLRLPLLFLIFSPVALLAQTTPESIPAPRALVMGVEGVGQSTVPAPVLPAPEDRTAEFIVNYTGFSTEAQTAFQYAVDIWSAVITSDVPIVIDATWEDLPGNTLGSAGATSLWYNFDGAPFTGVLYPSPLADKLAGSDLDPGSADMVANFDSGTDWYYGLDGNTPFSQYDLVSVVLHEIGHGLGFSGTMYVGVDLNGYVLNGSLAHIYDEFVYTGAGEALLDLGNGTAALGDALQSDNLYWAGIQANAYSGDFSPKLYAPAFWEQGSSLSHFDEATYPAGNPHSLMTPAIGNGEAVHSPGPMALGLLEDIGWTVDYDALGGTGGVPGCTDVEACNYDSEATDEDGSCLYPFAGEPCGECLSSWSLSANLEAGMGQSFDFVGVGSVGPVDVTVQWAGQSGNSEWVADLLVVLCDPNGHCVEWGGYDVTAGEDSAGVAWPEEWETTVGGTYMASLDLTASGLSGLGTWTVTVYNGYTQSSGLDLTDVSFAVPYICPLAGLEPGCTDQAACNYDAEADYNDGSCDYFCFACTGTLLEETFQQYDAVTPLTVQSTAGWETWSGPSGTAEDPFVVFDGLDGAVSLVSPEVDPAQDNDLFFPIGATEGTHVVQFTVRTEPGGTAYYNFQGDVIPAQEWTLDVLIDAEGVMTFLQESDTVGVATGFIVGQDNVFTNIVDLDNDECRVILGNSLVALVDYPGNLGGVNFYPLSVDGGLGAYLLDDVTVCAVSFESTGCADEAACNYDPDAGPGTEACEYAVGCDVCQEGEVIDGDVDDDGVCDEDEVPGCSDPQACNYDPEAGFDDGSCCYLCDGQLIGTWIWSGEAGAISVGPVPGSSEWYASLEGALVPEQYDDSWTFQPDGTYLFETNGGVMNPYEGFIITPISFAPGSYTLEPGLGIDGGDLLTIGDLVTDDLIPEPCGWMGLWDSGPEYTIVSMDAESMVLISPLRSADCTPQEGYFTLTFNRVVSGPACIAGCTDPEACNYDAGANYEDGSCEYAALYYDCSGACLSDADGDGVCDELEVEGCTDEAACNFDEGATDEDGSCEYAALYYDCSGACLSDADGDGVCDELEVEGCTDEAACNFDEGATDEDGSCAYLAGEMVSGNAQVTVGDTQLYTVSPSDPGNTYTWAVSGGTILDGQGTAIVTIEWMAEGQHALQVIESNPSCNGDLLELEVTVSPVISVEEQSLSDWMVYPNPASDGIRVEGLRIGAAPITVRLFQSDGRLVHQWPMTRNGAWLSLEGVAPGWYVLEGQAQGLRAVRPLWKE